MKIKLIAKEDLFSIIPFLQILNSEIGEDVLSSRLDDMISQGYLCVGAYDEGKLIGICGLWFLTKYYVGKHIEIDNMVIHPDYRSQRIGKEIMSWIYTFAKEKGCIASELNCYLLNEKGRKFWENEGYQILGHHYQKKL